MISILLCLNSSKIKSLNFCPKTVYVHIYSIFNYLIISFLFRDVDIEAQFSLNQSRAEEITMKEDYGSLSLVTHDQGFGDMGFDTPDMIQHSGGLAPSLDQVPFFIFNFIYNISDYYIVINKIECTKFFQKYIFLVNVDMCKIAKLYYFENK